jgi:Family of unknown function (DUF6675)
MIRLLLYILLCQTAVPGQTTPRPPCGEDAVPPYPSLDQSPVVKFWSKAEFGRDWKPPACTGWTETGFSTLITTVARFRYSAGSEALLGHIGAISEMAGMRYWSTTHKQWQTLIVDAHAVAGPKSGRRPDFLSGEMREGKVLYFEQADNLAGKAIYRMQVMKASPDRIVVATENITPMRYLLLTLFRPAEVQTIYFLDRESEKIWRYYALARTGPNANRLTAGHEASSINRAVAFYRYLAGIPTDQEPPAAR